MTTPKIFWQPHPGPQTQALMSVSRETLFGGAKGGGKTDAGLAWLMYDIDNPLLRMLVIRHNAEDLSDWVDRARLFYKSSGASIVGKPARIQWPSGALARIGHMKDEKAYLKYMGHEYQRILIEELTEMPRLIDYLKLIAACRSTVPGLPARVFMTTNPGGPGHGWVKERFIDVSPPSKVYIDPETGRSRIFIPAKVTDNPTLMKHDPSYIHFLNGLPEPTKSMWRDGSWDHVEGQFFSKFVKQIHVVEPKELPDEWGKAVGIDWGYCYSEDTEVLTKSGWKKFIDVEIFDEIMTLNPETKVSEYQRPENITWQYYNGDMFSYQNTNFDIKVTPNHKIWSHHEFDDKRKLHSHSAKDIKCKHVVPRSGNWQGKDVKHITNDIISFLGWYISEGYIRRSGLGNLSNKMIGISQSNITNRKIIIDLVTRLGCRYTERKLEISVESKELMQWCLLCGNGSSNKKIPQTIKDLPIRKLKILLESLMLGDRYDSWRYCTISKQLADDVQEIVLKIGMYGWINQKNGRNLYIVNINKRVRTHLIRKNWEVNKYKGYIGCVTVPNGIIYVRRNGKPTFCGNSPHPCSVSWWAKDFENVVYKYRELLMWESSPRTVALKILELSKDDKNIDTWVGGTDMWIRNPYSGGVQETFKAFSDKSIAFTFMNEGIPLLQANNDRFNGWQLMKTLMEWEGNFEDGKYNLTKFPMLYYFSTCFLTIKTMPMQQHDPIKPGDMIKKKGNTGTTPETYKGDDCCESDRYCLMHLLEGIEVEKDKSPMEKFLEAEKRNYGKGVVMAEKDDYRGWMDS